MPPKLPIEKPEKFKLGHYRGVRLLSVGEFFCYATFPLKLNWRQLMDRWGTEPFEDLRPSPVDVFSELHHYTTLIGMEGILSSNSLWATSYHFLNDSTEIVHIASYLEAALAPELDRYLRKARKSLVPLDLAIAKYGGPRTFSRMLAHSFVGRHYDSLFRGLGPSGKIHCEPFIVSFCTHHGDAEYERNNGLLSQWRSYGAQEGVAIV